MSSKPPIRQESGSMPNPSGVVLVLIFGVSDLTKTSIYCDYCSTTVLVFNSVLVTVTTRTVVGT